MVVNVKFQHCLSQNVKDDFDIFVCAFALQLCFSIQSRTRSEDDGDRFTGVVVFVVYNVLSHSVDVLLNVQAQMSSRCINMCLCHDKDQ